MLFNKIGKWVWIRIQFNKSLGKIVLKKFGYRAIANEILCMYLKCCRRKKKPQTIQTNKISVNRRQEKIYRVWNLPKGKRRFTNKWPNKSVISSINNSSIKGEIKEQKDQRKKTKKKKSKSNNKDTKFIAWSL